MDRLARVFAGACLFTLALVLRSAPLPVEAFTAPPEFRNPKLSPDGRTLALSGTRDYDNFVALLDLETMQVTPGATFSNLRVANYWWKGNDWMLFLVEEANGDSYFRSMDLKTKKVQALHSFNNRGGIVVNPLVEDPEHALVSNFTSTGVNLRKVNVRTGKISPVEDNPGFVLRWLTDRAGRPVVALGRLDEEWFMLWRPSPEADWQKTNLGHRLRPDFWPMAVYHDQRRILGWDSNTSDTARVVVRDPATGIDEPVFHSAEVDPSYNIVWGDDETRVRAIAYETDRPRFHYLDPADAQLAAAIDATLKDSTNSIVTTSADESRLVIESISDRSPEHYFLFDRKSGRLVSLGFSRGDLAKVAFGGSHYFKFAARDGLQLSARIFLPDGRPGPHPLIVFCGANYNDRALRSFYPLYMLLTSRGYAVMAVNQRGVDGFGQKLAAAGEKAIDTAMADDIAAAVDAAAKHGWAAMPRVALFGDSAGGVLAIYTLARHPEKFSAWINFNTPLRRGSLKWWDLSFGLTANRGRFVSFAREKALEDYLWTLAPLKVVPKFKVPSFHFYASDAMIDLEGGKLKKLLGTTGAPLNFVVGLESRKWEDTVEKLDRQRVEETSRIFRELLAFLEQHFPADPR